MKKVLMFAVATCTALVGLNSCGGSMLGSAAGSNLLASGAQTGGNLLSSVIGNFLNKNTTFTRANLVGTWNYQGPDCKFESENFLKQAGGEIAATTVENKLDEIFSKFGIKAGTCSFTFNEDGSYTANIGGHALNGTYTFDEATSKLTLVALFGLTKTEATVTHSSYTNISLLYDADKLVNLLTTLSAFSGSSAVSSITSLLSSYDGVKIGFELNKQ